MKKRIFLRALLGFPLGIAYGYCITIILSLAFSDGAYYSCVPALVNTMGSESNAVLFQALLCGLLGSAFAASSIIWEMDNWSIAKQTGIYFLIASLVMMPIAYFTNWMEHTILGFALYFGIFVLIFIVVWATQYWIIRNKIKKMNEKLK